MKENRTIIEKKLNELKRSKRLKLEKITIGNDLESLVGKCDQFCPQIEKFQRILTNQLSPFEREEKMFKSFSRDSNFVEEELRTEETLVNCWKELLEILSLEFKSKSKPNLLKIYQFLFDKSKSIRQDVQIQRLSSPLIVEIYQQISFFFFFFFLSIFFLIFFESSFSHYFRISVVE